MNRLHNLTIHTFIERKSSEKKKEGKKANIKKSISLSSIIDDNVIRVDFDYFKRSSCINIDMKKDNITPNHFINNNFYYNNNIKNNNNNNNNNNDNDNNDNNNNNNNNNDNDNDKDNDNNNVIEIYNNNFTNNFNNNSLYIFSSINNNFNNSCLSFSSFFPPSFSYILPLPSQTIFYLSTPTLILYGFVFIIFSGVFITVSIGMHSSLLSSPFCLIFIVFGFFSVIYMLLGFGEKNKKRKGIKGEL
jgi:hypothetical protein